jgi:hypothetical protein
MIIQVIKLGTVCTDKATELQGTLTHWCLDMDHRIDYLFQPQGLNPKDGRPIDKILVEQARLELPDGGFEDVDVPVKILGTQVTDKASGFSGMAVSFVRHINGCFHVAIQPKGRLPETNAPIRRMEFDLRGCIGEAIEQQSPEELEQSKEERPSPTGDSFPERTVSTEPTFRQ